MSPKKATIIIIVLALLIIAFFAYLFNANKKNSQRNFLPTANEANIDRVIEREKNKKYKEIGESAKERPYTQDEIDFILNPEKTVEQELGIKNNGDENKNIKPLSQDEIDTILNPKK